MKKPVFFLLLTLGLSLFAGSETATIPGSINSLCFYDNFFYNLPEQDFIYYFNDALLFTEPPDDSIYSDGMRDKFLRLLRQHRQIREYIAKSGNRQSATISFNLKTEEGFKSGVEFLALLGLNMKKISSGMMQIKPTDDDEIFKYYNFCSLRVSALQTQLNSTGIFFFKLQETTVHLPWNFRFLSDISGLKLDSETFFMEMIANKRLSLLLAILFRLSDKEIDFVGGDAPKTAGSAWKRIYLDKKMMMGMLVLSNALRVRGGQLLLPGGDRAKKFWAALAGSDPDRSPSDFLAKLCNLDNGKLNYLYVFSFFLPEMNRRALFFDYDEAKVLRLYQKITLGENEKIKANSFPRLENFTFYSLMHALKVRNERIVLPLGFSAWGQALGLDLTDPEDECGFFEGLLAASGRGDKKTSLLHKFISVYSKFVGRPQFLSLELLQKIFAGFESSNTVLDFLEKIPLKKTASADALLAWQESLLKLNQKDRLLYTALGQALLESIAHASGFTPGSVDFDAVINDLVAIPWQRPAFYDGLFAFIKKKSSADAPRAITDDSYLGFVLRGLKNQEVSIRDEPYEWRVRDMYLSDLQEMLRSQEVCSLSALSEINVLLDELAAAPASFGSRSRRLRDAFEQLPYPDFSKDAPKKLKDRVISYAKDDLDRDVRELLKLCEKNADRENIRKAIAVIKSEYLLPNAKDYFLALAYALNAKNPKLRMFMNPNLARLHDFSESGGSPWTGGCAPGDKTEFSGYYLKGGLSQLNLTFALNWRNQLFEKNIFNSEQTQAMIYNIMAMLPQPMIRHSGVLDALLVELAVEMLQKCRDNGPMKAAAQDATMTLTAGYHFRKLNDFLSGHVADYHLFFTELRQFGLSFSENSLFLDRFSQKDKLTKFMQMPLSAIVADESDPWGNIFFNSSGSLVPRANAFFPQETAQLFASGWFSGETLAEYKIKTAYLAYKNDLPSCLIGQFVFDFVSTVSRSVYSQNHVKDYHSTHFVLDIMNSAHLKNTLQKLQKSGFLRLR